MLCTSAVISLNQKGELTMKKLCLLMMTLALLLTVAFSEAENTLPATASYSIHILAEDWGCVADRVILSLDRPIDDASAYEYTVSRR